MVAHREPIPVTRRQLIATLRKEASSVYKNKHLRNVMVDIAARDLLETGRVRLVPSASPEYLSAA